MQMVPVIVAVDKRATACTVANIGRVHGLLPLTSVTAPLMLHHGLLTKEAIPLRLSAD